MRETLLLFIVLTEYCSSSCLFANVPSSLTHMFPSFLFVYYCHLVAVHGTSLSSLYDKGSY